jgi:uncharacterized membrane protein
VEQQSRDADRLSAYSDAVFAVIVTIMVLQLRAPDSSRLSALIKLWQPTASYVVSYVFIAIIWINHHYLSRLMRATTLPIIWINFVHLFFVSLLPFTTAWIAQTRLAATPVVTYAALFVCASGTYNVFERRVLRESDEVTTQERLMARYRSLLAFALLAFALFTSAAVLAAFVPWAGFGLICLALVLHLKPDVGVRRPRAGAVHAGLSERVVDLPVLQLQRRDATLPRAGTLENVAMTESAREDTITICAEKLLRGVIATNVRVESGGFLWSRGQVSGNVWIERGGRVHVLAVLDGDVRVAGRLVIYGTLNGKVVATRSASVVRRQ